MLRQVEMNYSGSVGSRYPKSIPSAHCAQQPLKEMKEISGFFCIFITSVYSGNVDQEYKNSELLCTTTLFCWFNWQPAGKRPDPKGVTLNEFYEYYGYFEVIKICITEGHNSTEHVSLSPLLLF